MTRPDEPAGPDRPSGLRDPAAAVRGVGAAALSLEALSLLLAVVPLVRLGVPHAGWAVATVLGLAALCVVLIRLLRYRWAWYAGIGVQVLLAGAGRFHLMLLALAVVFGAVWAYTLSVRRRILGRI